MFLWNTILVFLVVVLYPMALGQYSRTYERTSSSSSSYSYPGSSPRILPPYVSSVYSRPYTTSSYSRHSSSSSSSSSANFEPIVPYYNRPHCRNNMPMRYQIVPSGIVFTGYVAEVLPDRDNDNPDDQYQAQVIIKRVLYGPRNLGKGSKVTIAGFGHPKGEWCHANVKAGQTWIFITQTIVAPDYLRLNSSLLKMNLNNLERLEGIIDNEPYRPLTPVDQLPCEKKYCENNGNCVEDSAKADGARCECITYCKKNYAPVCASNNETYENECELRLRSCYVGKNLFVKSLTPCFTSRGQQVFPTTNYDRRGSASNNVGGDRSNSNRPSRPEFGEDDSRYTSSYTYRYSNNRGSNPSITPLPPLKPELGRESTSYRYNYRSQSSDIASNIDHHLF